MSQPIDPTESPTTIKEVGIHVGYMRADIHELKEIIKELPTAFATVKDLSVVANRVSKLEGRNNLKTTLTWVGLVTTTIISIIALYALFTQGR